METRHVVEIRALDYFWHEVEQATDHSPVMVVEKSAWRIQVRMAANEDWVNIPVVRINGRPEE